MKLKSLQVLIFSILISSCAMAQGFEAGLQAGLITSQISGDASGGYYKFGPTAGLFVKRQFRGAYSGEFGILYAPKGSKRFAKNAKGEILYEEYKLSIQYIEVPILFQYATDSLALTLEIGTYIGILLGAEEDEQGILINLGSFRNYEAGIVVGVSKRLSDRFSFGIRGSHSLTVARKHPSGEIWRLNRGQYNTCLMANLKFHFN
ncbi:MAG: PorT family protein [Flavobacteriales bacterium]|nr:PorT family protein [Flavobacteriales bacterium]